MILLHCQPNRWHTCHLHQVHNEAIYFCVSICLLLYFSFSFFLFLFPFPQWLSQPHVLVTTFNSGPLSLSLFLSSLAPWLSFWGPTAALIYSPLSTSPSSHFSHHLPVVPSVPLVQGWTLPPDALYPHKCTNADTQHAFFSLSLCVLGRKMSKEGENKRCGGAKFDLNRNDSALRGKKRERKKRCWCHIRIREGWWTDEGQGRKEEWWLVVQNSWTDI